MDSLIDYLNKCKITTLKERSDYMQKAANEDNGLLNQMYCEKAIHKNGFANGLSFAIKCIKEYNLPVDYREEK